MACELDDVSTNSDIPTRSQLNFWTSLAAQKPMHLPSSPPSPFQLAWKRLDPEFGRLCMTWWGFYQKRAPRFKFYKNDLQE